MLNMLKLKTSPNHSKSLILGSRDSFLSNFNIFKKINSNHLMLQPWNPKILRLQAVTWKFSKMCPVSTQVKFFSFWHYIPLDKHLIFLPTHAQDVQQPIGKSYVFSIYKKTIDCTNSQKVSLGSSRKVPYKSQLTLDPCHWPFIL